HTVTAERSSHAAGVERRDMRIALGRRVTVVVVAQSEPRDRTPRPRLLTLSAPSVLPGRRRTRIETAVGELPKEKIPRHASRDPQCHRPCRYIRGQSPVAICRCPRQTARRLSAEDLPVRRSATTSNEIFCPSFSVPQPARSTALMCTNTSLLPSSG